MGFYQKTSGFLPKIPKKYKTKTKKQKKSKKIQKFPRNSQEIPRNSGTKTPKTSPNSCSCPGRRPSRTPRGSWWLWRPGPSGRRDGDAVAWRGENACNRQWGGMGGWDWKVVLFCCFGWFGLFVGLVWFWFVWFVFFVGLLVCLLVC